MENGYYKATLHDTQFDTVSKNIYSITYNRNARFSLSLQHITILHRHTIGSSVSVWKNNTTTSVYCYVSFIYTHAYVC